MKVYLISGLGGDERLFQNLKPIEGYTYVPLQFVAPEKAKSLADYARLMANAYTFEEPFILGGVSIGGMIAQELSHIVSPEKLILISTVRHRNEISKWVRAANKKWVKALIHTKLIFFLAKMGDKFTRKSIYGRELFYDMLYSSNPDFLKFGARAVMDWLPPKVNVPVIRIHGTNDQVFPKSGIKDKNVIWIPKGNHFMIYERGEEIGSLLAKHI